MPTAKWRLISAAMDTALSSKLASEPVNGVLDLIDIAQVPRRGFGKKRVGC
jgi:hypothetical protein